MSLIGFIKGLVGVADKAPSKLPPLQPSVAVLPGVTPHDTTDLAAFVSHFEGYGGLLARNPNAPYRCPAGVWTIGYGSTRDEAGNPVTALTPDTTHEKALKLLHRDLAGADRDVTRSVTVPLTTNQHAALVSFTYNLGVGNLQASSLLRLTNAKAFPAAADAFLLWNKGRVNGVLTTLPGLVKRRAAERGLFLTP